MNRLDKRVSAICLVLVLLVAVVFCQTGRFEFVNFDDDSYVYNNEHITKGLSLNSLGHYVFYRHGYTYHPITTYSHMLDCQLFGTRAGMHHLMNVLYHLATVVGLFLVLRAMTGRLWPSAVVAAIFAIHPLRVESVAWVSERKDVLSGLFFVLTLGAYVRYVRKPEDTARYVVLCATFALGLLAKPMLVTVPFVLLLLDYWPLGRWRLHAIQSEEEACEGLYGPPTMESLLTDGSSLAESDDGIAEAHSCQAVMAAVTPDPRPNRREVTWRLFTEKVPLMLLSLAASVVTIFTQGDGGAIQPLSYISWTMRFANAFDSYVNYLGLFFWPRGLAVLYPFPVNMVFKDALGKACLLAVISTCVFIAWRRLPYVLVGWLWYVGMLVPVIGLMQVGGQSMADRYTYLPQIGLAIALVWTATAAVDWFRGQGQPVSASYSDFSFIRSILGAIVQGMAALAAVGIIAGLAAAAWNQTKHWKNSEALWERDMLYANTVMYYNYGLALAENGHHREAIEQYVKGLDIEPGDQDTHYSLGLSYEAVNEIDNAIDEYRAATTAAAAKNIKAENAARNLERLLHKRTEDHKAAKNVDKLKPAPKGAVVAVPTAAPRLTAATGKAK